MLILGTICMLTMCLKNHIGTVADEGKLEQERSRPGGTSAETNDEATSIVCFFMLWPLADFGLPCLKDPLLFLKILSSLTGQFNQIHGHYTSIVYNVDFSFSSYRSLPKYKLKDSTSEYTSNNPSQLFFSITLAIPPSYRLNYYFLFRALNQALRLEAKPIISVLGPPF